MLSKEEIEEVKKFVNNILLKHDWFDNAYLLAGNAKTLIMYIEQLESEKQKLIEKLEKDNKQDKESVQYYEKVRRDCQENSDEYKKIYQNVINKLNEKRMLRKEILEILKGEKQWLMNN